MKSSLVAFTLTCGLALAIPTANGNAHALVKRAALDDVSSAEST